MKDERILQTLRKLSALRNSPHSGERAAAQKRIDEVCAKYGISPDEIEAQEVAWTSFSFKTTWEKELILCCASMILNARALSYGIRNKKISLELSLSQKIDLDSCFSHYRKEWETLQEEVFRAFINRHQIGTAPTEEEIMEGIKGMSREDAIRLAKRQSLAQQLPSSDWNKRRQLTTGQGGSRC